MRSKLTVFPFEHYHPWDAAVWALGWFRVSLGLCLRYIQVSSSCRQDLYLKEKQRSWSLFVTTCSLMLVSVAITTKRQCLFLICCSSARWDGDSPSYLCYSCTVSSCRGEWVKKKEKPPRSVQCDSLDSSWYSPQGPNDSAHRHPLVIPSVLSTDDITNTSVFNKNTLGKS